MTLQEMMSQLGGLFSDKSGVQDNMTVPTSYNTSSEWVPPGTQAPVGNTSAGLGTGLGANVGTGQLALSGLGSLAGLWGASQANKLAQDQFKFTKATTNTNLNNQIKSYNTSLEDRLNSRGFVQGDDAALTQANIDKNRLTR